LQRYILTGRPLNGSTHAKVPTWENREQWQSQVTQPNP
jgi:hypothetical protein